MQRPSIRSAMEAERPLVTPLASVAALALSRNTPAAPKGIQPVRKVKSTKIMANEPLGAFTSQRPSAMRDRHSPR